MNFYEFFILISNFCCSRGKNNNISWVKLKDFEIFPNIFLKISGNLSSFCVIGRRISLTFILFWGKKYKLCIIRNSIFYAILSKKYIYMASLLFRNATNYSSLLFQKFSNSVRNTDKGIITTRWCNIPGTWKTITSCLF